MTLSKTIIYCDHNATSPSSKDHLAAVFDVLPGVLGNPSSPHSLGRAASVALTTARRQVARALGVDVSEVIFTSGATEANNMATFGVLGREPGSHAVSTAIEHPSLHQPLSVFEHQSGQAVTFVKPDRQGVVAARDVLRSLEPQTRYLAIMAANNEVGSLQPVGLIGDFLAYQRWGVVGATPRDILLDLESCLAPAVTKDVLGQLHFHVDAVQAFGKLPVAQWLSLGVDSCAVSGHKLGALPGVGVLFLRRGRKLRSVLHGGAQERNRRPGTENLAGIVSMGLICQDMESTAWWPAWETVNALRRQLHQALSLIPGIVLTSALDQTLPNTVHFYIDTNNSFGVNAEDLLLFFDLEGICASSGAACSSGANKPSAVLLAMGFDAQQAQNTIRLSLGKSTTLQDVERLVSCVKRYLIK